jgi:hypothetical protein
MSHIVFSEYLNLKFKDSNIGFSNNLKNNRAAVIVEPRKHEFLEPVLRNVATILNSSWNIYVVTFDIEWIKNILGSNWNISFIKLNVDNLTQEQYSNLLMSKEFWELFKEESILIFQSDCIFFKEGLEKFLEYDYIGPNYYNISHMTPLSNGIQGGVSLRKRSVMLECIDKVSYDSMNKYRISKGFPIIDKVIEDVFFTHACEILKKNVATKKINSLFGIEADYEPDTHCHHGFNKHYFSIKDAIGLVSDN